MMDAGAAVAGTNGEGAERAAASLLAVFASLMASFIRLPFVLSREAQTLEQQVMLDIKSAFVFDCIRVCFPSARSPSTKTNIWIGYRPVGTVNTHYTEEILYLG